MNLGQSLLLGALSSAEEPTVNQGLHVDASGNFVDATGKPMAPYSGTGFLARMLSPDARSAYMANQQATLAPQQAQQNENIQEITQANRFGQLPTDYFNNTPLATMNNRARAIASNDNPEYTNLKSLTGSKADIDLGVPEMQANEAFNEATAGTEEAKNRATRAAIGGLLGNPGLSAQTENAGLGLQLGQIAGENALLPSRLNLEGQDISNQTGLGAGLKQRIPLLNNASLSQAGIENATTGEAVRDLPNTLGTLRNRSVLENYGSQFENPNALLSAKVTGDTVGLGRNPLFVSPMQQQMAMLNAGNVGSSNITLPSGLKGTAAPLYTAPSGQSNVEQIQARGGQGGMGATPVQNTGTPPPTANGSSAKTDDYATLIKAANDAAQMYGRNSPQYAQALAKIHSVESEQMPDVIDYSPASKTSDGYNSTGAFALGSLVNQGVHGLGKYARAVGNTYTKDGKKVLGALKGVGKSFMSGLNDEDDE